jgi:hypothetical protein
LPWTGGNPISASVWFGDGIDMRHVALHHKVMTTVVAQVLQTPVYP